MSIQEQIQIVEDNLNEYGQCNITIEEFNYLKDEIYADGCLAGMEQGRADVIEQCIDILHNHYEVRNAEQNTFMDMLVMEFLRLKEQR